MWHAMAWCKLQNHLEAEDQSTRSFHWLGRELYLQPLKDKRGVRVFRLHVVIGVARPFHLIHFRYLSK